VVAFLLAAFGWRPAMSARQHPHGSVQLHQWARRKRGLSRILVRGAVRFIKRAFAAPAAVIRNRLMRATLARFGLTEQCRWRWPTKGIAFPANHVQSVTADIADCRFVENKRGLPDGGRCWTR
jgi:hypothetical protein